MFNNSFFFFENFAFYAIMSKNMVDPESHKKFVDARNKNKLQHTLEKKEILTKTYMFYSNFISHIYTIFISVLII